MSLEHAFPPPTGGPTFHNRVEVFYEYDERGRLARQSNPTWVGTTPPAWTEWSYDNLDRKLSATLLDALFMPIHDEPELWSYDYGALGSGRVVLETYTDQDLKTTRRYYDGANRVIEAYDGENTPTGFVYGPFDLVREVRRGGLYAHDALSITSYEYDALGRRVSETAPESGTSTVDYTAFGEVEAVTLPEGTTGFVHDDLGRVTDRVDADGFHNWTYDTQRVGALSSTTSADGITRAYTYDDWARTQTETTTGPQGAFSLSYTYDAYDRLESVSYPEPGYVVFNEYDVFGYHRRTRSQRAPCAMTDAAIDWEWLSADPAGNVTSERFGNGTQTSRHYEDGTYRPETITTLSPANGTLQSLEYGWTGAGDLRFRTDYGAGETEDFTYDEAHRLLTWAWAGTTFETQFDALGNITQKSGQGTYTYDPATDRLSSVGTHSYSYDDNGNVLTDGERTLTWTAQNKVRSLQEGGQAWSVGYDADGTRVVREETSSNSATYNISATYELRFEAASLSEARISVLSSTGRVVAELVAERTELVANDRWEGVKTFVHDDHLGSTHIVTDREGAVASRVMYGPWGTARDGDDWTFGMTEAALAELPAGFTGHQPELDAGLINMRGRMYDPEVGRFMSVDPVIENAVEVGTWNAYSYVLNRPLSMVDPTGLAASQKEALDTELAYQDLEYMMAEFLAAVGGIQGIGSSVPLSVRVEDRVEAEKRQKAKGKQAQQRKGVTYPALEGGRALPSKVQNLSVTLPDGTKIDMAVVADLRSVYPDAPSNADAAIDLVDFEVLESSGGFEISLEFSLVVTHEGAKKWLRSNAGNPTLRDHESIHAFISQNAFKKELDSRAGQLASLTSRQAARVLGDKAFDDARLISKIANGKFDSKTGHNDPDVGKYLNLWTNEARMEKTIDKLRKWRNGTDFQKWRFRNHEERFARK